MQSMKVGNVRRQKTMLVRYIGRYHNTEFTFIIYVVAVCAYGWSTHTWIAKEAIEECERRGPHELR